MKPYDVVGIGLNAVDTLIVVDRYPAFNTKVPLRRHVRSAGGQIATAMTALARLGKQVAYVGKVGDDETGLFQRQSLEREALARLDLRVATGAETQTAYIVIEAESGERTIIWHHDPQLDFTPEEIPPDLIRAGKLLHLDGQSTAAAIRAAEIARANSIPVCLDIDELYPGAEGLLPLVDYLTASTDFPASVTGIHDPEQALQELARQFGSKIVTMTLGVEGSLALCDGKFYYTPAFSVPCADTTGAGDAFRGGFLFGLLEGFPLEKTMQIANAVAALKCRQLGARTALPTWAEVEALLN
ncbi:MAG: ribokinase [Blastocatellia bacterium]|nr:ribokinase [Blastocatellia bacterium]